MASTRGGVKLHVRRSHLPKRKIEINNAGTGFVDVSDYIMENTSFNQITTDSVGTGNLILDSNVRDVITNINSNDEIKIYLDYSSPSSHVFTGLLGNISEQGSQIQSDFFDFGQLILQRQYTGVHRQDAGTGNLVDIVKTILIKLFPELTWTSDSLPTTTESFFRKPYQNRYTNEVFDEIAGILTRQWWVDKDKVFHMRQRSFEPSGLTITGGTDIIGDLLIVTDVSKWANYVIVEGRKYLVSFKESFIGDGITKDFTLSKIPFDIEVDIGGTIMSGSFTGADNYLSADYLVNQLIPNISFQNNAPVSGDTTNVAYRYLTKVHEEIADSASSDEFRRVDKSLPVGLIESNADAFTIGQNYLDIYSKPLKIYTARIPGTKDINIATKVTLVESTKGINELVNVIGISHVFGLEGWVVDAQMTDFPSEFPDLYAELLTRVRRIEELDKISGEYILNYQMYGKRIDIGIVASLWTQAINDSMIWGHPSGSNSKWGTAKWGDRRGAETLVYEDM